MKMRLTRLKSNHQNLRTDTVVGEAVSVPMVGSNFVIVGEALDKNADFRIVNTTLIKSVNEVEQGIFEFETANSSYRAQILE